MRGCDVAAPVNHEQSLFLHMFSVDPCQSYNRSMPTQADWFMYFDCISIFVDDRPNRQYFDFPVFQLHQIVVDCRKEV